MMLLRDNPRKVFWTVRELAELAGVSRRTMWQLLRRLEVRTTPAAVPRGGKARVSLDSLAEAFPELLRSVDLAREADRW